MKKIIIALVVLVVVGAVAVLFYMNNVKTKSVLIVLSGKNYITDSEGKKHETGYWLEEFSTPYKIFKDNGLDVTIATPEGNRPAADPASIAVDANGKPIYWSSDEAYEEALKIKAAVLDSGEIKNLAELNKEGLSKFDAVFFPGGHAPMEDLAVDKNVAETLNYFHKKNKPTALVCHAPIALISTVEEGVFPYAGYQVTAFSNSEEQASEVGKYLVITPETALTNAGAVYSKGPDWQAYIVEDKELITGQNPASSKEIAEKLVEKMGIKGIFRADT